MDIENFPIYSMDEFVKNFHEILGIEKGEEVTIMTPQFLREYKLEIDWKPQSKDEFAILKSLPKEVLLKMGVRMWDKNNETGEVHYLYPGEWYDLIPDRYFIISISDKEERFQKGMTDDDIRFGCLAYGFKRIES